jgi:hypothetical protein
MYSVGGVPPAGGDHDATITLPTADAEKLVGIPGGEHVPGKASVTLFEGPLEPPVLKARTEKL